MKVERVVDNGWEVEEGGCTPGDVVWEGCVGKKLSGADGCLCS